jgi:acyl-CoA reductase-like NAD-dependent aldehyde dehydrogenase
LTCRDQLGDDLLPTADLDQATDALMGVACGSAGERWKAVSLAVGGGGDWLLDKIVLRVRALKIGSDTDVEAETRLPVTPQDDDSALARRHRRGALTARARSGQNAFGRPA